MPAFGQIAVGKRRPFAGQSKNEKTTTAWLARTMFALDLLVFERLCASAIGSPIGGTRAALKLWRLK